VTRSQAYNGGELSVFVAVSPAVAELAGLSQPSIRAPMRVASLSVELSLKAWLAHEILSRPSACRLDLEYAERTAELGRV